MPRKPGKPNTYNRIIDISLQLFNEEGERNISTNHISQRLSISPGNLYYHFRNKDEIIVQLFLRYSNKLLDYIRQTELPGSMAKMGEYLQGVYDILWEYRFLFSDVNTLLARSKQLLGEHNEFSHEKISPLLVKIFIELRDKGIIEAEDEALRELSQILARLQQLPAHRLLGRKRQTARHLPNHEPDTRLCEQRALPKLLRTDGAISLLKQQTKRQPETAFPLPLNIAGDLAAFPYGCHARQTKAFAKPGLFSPTFSGSLPPGIEGYLKNKSASSALLYTVDQG